MFIISHSKDNQLLFFSGFFFFNAFPKRRHQDNSIWAFFKYKIGFNKLVFILPLDGNEVKN